MKSQKTSPLLAISIVTTLLTAGLFGGCASSLPYKTQEYAAQRSERTFEYEMPVVYRAIEKALEKQNVQKRSPKKVTNSELNQLSEAEWVTDWIYSQSRDKYVEYTIDSIPRRKPLQVRLKQTIVARRNIAGVQISVRTEEELERINANGSPNGYEEVTPDSSRAAELLDRIQLAILSLGGGKDLP